MDAILQIVGAIMILIAFVMAQMRRMSPHSFSYLMLNFVGSALLGVLAARGQQWGFLLLEIVWAAVSLAGLWNWLKQRVKNSPPGD